MRQFSILAITKWSVLLVGLLVLSFSSCKQDEVLPLTKEQELTIEADENLIEGKYIVVFEENFITSSKRSGKEFTDRTAKRHFSEAHRAEATPKIKKFLKENIIEESRVSGTYTAAFTGFAAELTQDEVTALRANPNVKGVEQDRILSIKDVIGQKGGDEDARGFDRVQFTSCGVTAAGGPGSGPSSKWIWIIDSGIDLNHADLNVQTGTPFAASFVGGSAQDCHGHGSHIAGLAAARNNTIGVVGVSAGATVVPVKIFPGCSLSAPTSTILNGINHVAMYDVSGDVVNLSLGGYYGWFFCNNFSSYRSAISGLASNGTRVAIAAGNDSANAANYQPACVNMTNVYTVAAMTCGNVFDSSYSNWNMNPIDYIAAGTNLYSCNWNGGYRLMTGTSMATPIVAGILHARQAAPLTGGLVFFSGESYPIARR